jgi:hypothetical protein
MFVAANTLLDASVEWRANSAFQPTPRSRRG